MKHRTSTPRDNWRQIVEEQGLIYAVHAAESGEEPVQYWNEAEYFEFEESEIDYLEGVTQELHEMAIEATKEMARSSEYLARFDVPFLAGDFMRKSFDDEREISLYGRFDLAWGGTGDAKLLEYNADTPAALVEAAVVQWLWLEAIFPDNDQWNMIHERLVQAWKEHSDLIVEGRVHFAAAQDEPDEDWATVAYLRDTAREAGLTDFGITMDEIGWDATRNRFVDGQNVDITTIFKMYPWDWMLNEEFGKYVLLGQSATRWIEPAWKMLTGSKALLAMMWQMHPNHPNLLPTFLDKPASMTEYVAKPILGWEGAGIRIVTKDGEVANDASHSAGQRDVFQQYFPLPKFNDKHVVLGTWVINGHAAGLGIRQSASPITDTWAQFVPHIINTARASDDQIAAWLNSDA